MSMSMDIEAIKAKNLSVMKEVTAKLKAEASTPAVKTKEVPAAKLLKEVGIKAKAPKAAKAPGAAKGQSKQAVSVRLYDEAKLTERDAFVKALQVEFPDLSDFNARCYFNKVRTK